MTITIRLNRQSLTKALIVFVVVNILFCAALNTAWFILVAKPATNFEIVQLIISVQDKVFWLPWVYLDHDGLYCTLQWFGSTAFLW